MSKSNKIFITIALIVVLVILIVAVVIVVNNKNTEWILQAENNEYGFQIVFNKNDSSERKTILDGSTSSRIDYSIYALGGDVDVIIRR